MTRDIEPSHAMLLLCIKADILFKQIVLEENMKGKDKLHHFSPWGILAAFPLSVRLLPAVGINMTIGIARLAPV